jgi:hypothetical protein
MMSNSLPGMAQARRITEVLRRANLPANICVREVVIESSRPTILSRIIRLRLGYAETTVGAPDTLILKTGLPERIGSGWKAGLQEVAFYRDVAEATKPRLVPRCFEAFHDATTEEWHLLLEDLTDTHVIATAWPLPPTTGQCQRIIDTLARFHAAWWDDPRLGASIGTWRDEAASHRLMSDLAAHFTRFADRLGDSLSLERRALY